MDRPVLSMGTILRNEMAARGESPYGFAEHFPMPIADAIELLSNSAELQTWQMEDPRRLLGNPSLSFLGCSATGYHCRGRRCAFRLKGRNLMRNYHNGFLIWDDDLERELFTEEEIKANNKRVAKMLKYIKRKEAIKMGISEWAAKLSTMTPEEELNTVKLLDVSFHKGVMYLSWDGIMGFGEYCVELDEKTGTLIGHSEGMDIHDSNKEFLRKLLNQFADKVDLTEEIARHEDWRKRNGRQ